MGGVFRYTNVAVTFCYQQEHSPSPNIICMHSALADILLVYLQQSCGGGHFEVCDQMHHSQPVAVAQGGVGTPPSPVGGS